MTKKIHINLQELKPTRKDRDGGRDNNKAQNQQSH